MTLEGHLDNHFVLIQVAHGRVLVQEGLCSAWMEVRVDDGRVRAGDKAGQRPLATWPLNCQLTLRRRGGPSGFVRGQEPTAEAVGPEHLTGCHQRQPRRPAHPRAPNLPSFRVSHKVFNKCRVLLAKYVTLLPLPNPSYLGNTDMREGSLHHALVVGVRSGSGWPTASSLLTSAHWLG